MINSGSILLHELRSSNPRTKYSVGQRISSGDFIEQYQTDLDLAFSSVLVTNVKLMESAVVPKEKSKRHPFADFFSPYFGLGVVILAVSVLWCLLLRAEDGETDDLRLKQLQEEKRKFELKYGLIEEDSLDRTEKEILESVEMADNTKETTGTQGETKTSSTDAQPQTQTQIQTETQDQAQIQPQTQDPNGEKNATSQYAYRASVVDEVKHVKNPEERESVDLDQIKDPGKKRRKTQEYLNNLWDDKTQKAPKAAAEEEEDEQDEQDEHDEQDEE
ncbi:translation initiation factor subunit eIF4G like protein [Reticulomyxa filosa]|uniref:Translation initiation factor subunit eIF4G like protein n=1 Tax=Reticulomyxa filosa TaxID=46433 RepID=X6PAS7_RETFI|nr:translation initiation factor subunit eIF4G like protein [Reticulomyxa filosa]|eukprot:ETO34747.1 translation initiation factor subunit eIF4G like protein [Reticulomyxa filosa]